MYQRLIDGFAEVDLMDESVESIWLLTIWVFTRGQRAAYIHDEMVEWVLHHGD